ncbi:hypothetical protein [Paludisphaera sp.]|uniref:hypothetical protein n=1 Tax=Paludisphaera sp. TaxID=2017432 RepID=UPI00301BC144
MGHRANLIVVRGGGYDLRYSHWAANSLPRDLFWGPRHAIAFTEAQPAAGTEWLDDVWAEGGSVIDVDRRVFRLFGGEDLRYDVPLRRLYLSLLGVAWRGWDVGWADEGIADLADYVGYPRERVITPAEDRLAPPDLRPPQSPDHVEVVGSARLEDGSLRLFPLEWNVDDHLLLSGSKVAAAVASRPGLGRLALAEWTNTFPTGGFHLDLGAKRLFYWTAGDQPGVSTRLAARWPGWSVTWLRDRYEDQLAACGGALSFPVRTPSALFDELRSMLLHQRKVSPVETMLRLTERERAAGKTVEINSSALRDERVELAAETRAEILRRAAIELGFS